MRSSSVGRADDTSLRPEIELAWHRARMNGLDPGAEVGGSVISEINSQSRLALAARPVLDKISADLAGSRFTVLLSDRSSRIIDRRMGQRRQARRLDRVRAIPGVQFTEETSGTNALATAHELQRPIAVVGTEHFLESLKMFCCFAAPIIHPVTRRLEGVIDVTGPVEDDTPLLGPYVMRAASDIKQRLVDSARLAERLLLAEFQARSRNKTHPVLVLGTDVVLSNPATLDWVHNTDYAMLRSIAGDLGDDTSLERPITLSSGAHGVARIEAVPDTRGGVIVEIQPGPHPHQAQRTGHQRENTPVAATDDPAGQADIVLIIGEPGSGRTSRAQAIAGADALTIDAMESVESEGDWLRNALLALKAAKPIVLDNIHMLAPRPAACLAHAIRTAGHRIVMTSSPLPELEPEQAALAAMAMDRHHLPPVRVYQNDFASLANSVLRQLNPTSTLAIAPSTLSLLAAHSWPGNIRELQDVLHQAARGRDCGFIVEADLPADYRSSDTKYLTPMERAEREAIIAVMRAVEGNKAAAAMELGISRTTLYDRLRRYRIEM
ncbi:sigma-54-dependent Fis family transcriptional regulator [Mycobacterium paragordonae]|uniref:sigma-54-dependent Fis family transcriptional regulator n=1 Tax=Mycobacterium paragordonae TaxID=1389713 RepID=UPI0012E131A9|nr:helix-turn-helix domain-containing protein [Mycobacterium paragordonae]